MKILHATIIETPASVDLVMLHTDLPEACWPFTGQQALDFTCAIGTAKSYLQEHFPDVPVTVIVEPAYRGSQRYV